jgi:ketosteroid isomerase-like protein
VPDLETLERALLASLQSGDAAARADLLHDDFLITTAGWLSEPVGKQEWLDASSGRMTLDRFDLKILATRSYGDVRIVLVESHQEGSHDGNEYALTFRYTDVWVEDQSGVRLAARHASIVPN